MANTMDKLRELSERMVARSQHCENTKDAIAMQEHAAELDATLRESEAQGEQVNAAYAALLRQALEAMEELQYAVVSTAKTDDVSLYYRAIAALSAALAESTRKQSLQVAEQRGPEHISSPECWCHPELDYKDPETGAEVWVHRRMQ